MSYQAEQDEIPALARRAAETFVREGGIIDYMPSAESSLLRQRGACFVSIKTKDRKLRGCIGTVKPTQPSVAAEIVRNAIGAATRDPRFLPVVEAEFPSLRFSVDLLTTPEPALLKDLNPAHYGIIVENETGTRRGLLLPNVDGIETVEQQVRMATRKAGLPSGIQPKLYRFCVLRFREATRSEQTTKQGA